MPNWCQNVLVLTGDSSQLKPVRDLIEASMNKVGLFGLFHPVPQKLQDTVAGRYAPFSPEQSDHEELQKLNIAEFGHPDWYSWCLENWGTKWDVYPNDITVISDETNSITLRFDTAWSPPIEFYDFVSNLGFKVKAYYIEFGNSFAGCWTSEKGDEQICFTGDEDYNYTVTEGNKDLLPVILEVFDIEQGESSYF